jgi:ATP synthase assembly factor FMC1, mitochondrial
LEEMGVEEGCVRERIEEAEQFIAYLKAQRIYTTLVERYNPGLGMEEDEKVRLTARRVGMDLPVEYKPGS